MLRLPPPLWTLLFLILAALISYLTGWPTSRYIHSLPAGLALIAVSFIPPIWAIVEFHRHRTQINVLAQTNNRLVTSGPFRFTRNPMYLGLVVLGLGVAVASGAPLLLAAPVLTFATANWVHIPFEETKMRRQFGVAYDDYRMKVRRWI